MGIFQKPIHIFIINPQDINGVYDLFPKYVSRNDIYQEREYNEKTFYWKGVFFNSTNLDIILNNIEEKILSIKNKDKIQNNIVIAKNISTIPLFNKINAINGQLDTKILVIYISNEKLETIRKFDNRTITNIYGEKIYDRKFMEEKLRYLLSLKDCIFNQRTLEFKQALDSLNIVPTSKFLNILIIGPSRAGKSTLCNTLLNKYEALESSALESVTTIVNEYSNDYFHIFDTPGITITKNKKLGNTSEIVIKCLKKVFDKVKDSIDDMHAIFFVLKYSPNIENIIPVLKFLDKENEQRIKNNLKKIPIIFLVNEKKEQNDENSDDEFEDINNFKNTVQGLKNSFEKNNIKNLYSNYDDEIISEDEDHNIMRVDIRRERNALSKIFRKLYYYLRRVNPLSPILFQKMQEIKLKFDILNAQKKNLILNSEEKNRLNEEFKNNKELCQQIILNISQENSFYNKIFSLENILDSSEIKAKIAIAICCITTFGSGFIPIPFVDIPLVYTQQAVMILYIAFSYGFAIDEIPFKALIGAIFGVGVGLSGGGIETAAHIGVQKGAIIEKTITQVGEKFVNKAIEVTAKSSLEIAGKKTSEKIGIKLLEEGGKQIQEILVKNSIKKGTGIITKKVSSEILKEGGEIIGKEIGKKLASEAGEEIGKMTTSKITKEIATELIKQSGKTGISGTVVESSKIIPIIGTIIGGSISGSINLATTVGMGLSVREFFRYLVCLNAGAGYVLNKKLIIDEIFSFMERVINNEINLPKIEYIEC